MIRREKKNRGVGTGREENTASLLFACDEIIYFENISKSKQNSYWGKKKKTGNALKWHIIKPIF